MNNFLINLPQANKLKTITQNLNTLIKQLKKQGGDKVQLPRILQQSKSCTQNNEGKMKINQLSVMQKKSPTHKILQLSKKWRLSTININQSIGNHKRYASQHLYTLTQEQKQLLTQKEVRVSQGNEVKKNKFQINDAKQIIKQMKNFHQEQKKKQKQKQLFNKQSKNKIYLLILNEDQLLKDTKSKGSDLKPQKVSYQRRNQKQINKLSFRNQRFLRFHCRELDGKIQSILMKRSEIKDQNQNQSKVKRIDSQKTVQYNLKDRMKSQISQKTQQSSPYSYRKNSKFIKFRSLVKSKLNSIPFKKTFYQPWDNVNPSKKSQDFCEQQFSIQNYQQE